MKLNSQNCANYFAYIFLQLLSTHLATATDVASVEPEDFIIYRRFEKGHKSITIYEGDTLEIYCNVSGLQPNETVGNIPMKFYKDGVLLPNYWRWRNRKLVREDKVIPRSGHSFAYLDAQLRHHGEYKCEAKNQSTIFTVRVKDNWGAMWPFLIICAEILILWTLTKIYELYEKKQIKINIFEDRPDFTL